VRGILLASAVATVRGIVHDPQHRPIADAEVVLKAEHSDFHPDGADERRR